MDVEQAKKDNVQLAQVDFHTVGLTYAPSAVKKLCFGRGRLIVGRENGLVEVLQAGTFNLVGAYVSVCSPVSGLAWIDENGRKRYLRDLFFFITFFSLLDFIVSYLSGAIYIYSVDTPYPKTHLQLTATVAIFDLAMINANTAVVACSDGAVRVIEITDDCKLHIPFQSQNHQDQQCVGIDVYDLTVFVSYSSGVVRQYQYKYPSSLSLVQLIQLQPAVAKSNISIPWVVKASEQYIFIGSGAGTIQVFERKFFTEVIKLQTHQASILSGLIVGNNAYFSGTDSKVVSINIHTLKICGEVRGQSHDVYALSMVGDRLVSSGANADLCFYGVRGDGSFESTNSSTLFRIQPVPQKNMLSLENTTKVKKGSSILLALNERTKITLSIMDDINADFIEVAEIQTQDLVHTVCISPKCTYLMYSHQHKSVVLRVLWTDGRFESVQKIGDLEPAVQGEFTKGGFLYYVNKQNQLYQVALPTLVRTFIVKLDLSSVSYMKAIDSINQLVIVSNSDQKLISLNTSKQNQNQIQELDVALPEHHLVDCSLLSGQNQVLGFVYDRNRLCTYIYSKNPENQNWDWKMSQHSKKYLYQFPKEMLQMKQQIKGALCDGKDEKKILLYSNNTIVKFHQRGIPSDHMTTGSSINEQNELKLDQNFSVYQSPNHKVLIYLTQLKKLKISQAIVFEWDKDASFANLQQAFNAKKYKQ